jgi:hypothetical protein
MIASKVTPCLHVNRAAATDGVVCFYVFGSVAGGPPVYTNSTSTLVHGGLVKYMCVKESAHAVGDLMIAVSHPVEISLLLGVRCWPWMFSSGHKVAAL